MPTEEPPERTLPTDDIVLAAVLFVVGSLGTCIGVSADRRKGRVGRSQHERLAHSALSDSTTRGAGTVRRARRSTRTGTTIIGIPRRWRRFCTMNAVSL